MRHLDSTSFIYPTKYMRHLFGMLRAVGYQNRFNTWIGGDSFNGNVPWTSRMINTSTYMERLFLFSDDARTGILSPRGVAAAHTVLSGYVFDLRRGRRSFDETKFFYELNLEGTNSVPCEIFVSLSQLPEPFFEDAYTAATAFRLGSHFVKSWIPYCDDHWVKNPV